LDREKLQRDIETLRESIVLERMNLHELDGAGVRAVLASIAHLMLEIESLKKQLEVLERAKAGSPPN